MTVVTPMRLKTASRCLLRTTVVAAVLLTVGALSAVPPAGSCEGMQPPVPTSQPLPQAPSAPPAQPGAVVPVAQAGLLAGEIASVDLPSVLALAGVQNPDLLIARQRVVEAVAWRQFAAAQ